MKERGTIVRRSKRDVAGAAQPPWVARLALAGLRRIAPLLRAFRIEPQKLMALLELRFALDARATRSLAEGRTGVDLGRMLVGSATFGLFTTIVVVTVPTPGMAVGVIAGALWVAVPMMLLGAWLDVLLDGSAESVIAPTPIGDRTVLAARLIFLATYAAATVTTIVAMPLVVGSFCHGVWPFLPIGIIATASASVCAVLVLLLVFLALARIVPGDRFRIWALRCQFAAAIAFPLLWQILPRMLPTSSESMPHWVVLVVPPCWPAGFAAWCGDELVPWASLRTTLTFAAPIALFGLALALANRRFVAATASPQTESHVPAPFRAGRPTRWFARVCTDADERAGFEFARLSTLRERSYAMQTLPAMILPLVLFAASLFLVDRDMHSAPFWALCGILPLVLALNLPICIWAARATESPDAAWIRDIAPFADDRPMRSGLFKALLVRWCFVPSFIAFAACTFIGLARGALFAFVTALAAFHVDVVACLVLDVRRPFRIAYSTDRVARDAPTLVFFLHAILVCGTGFGLVALHRSPIVLAIGGVVLLALAPLRWRALRS
ncbi:MAG: hypothetical protein IPH13_08670 [Planctomycetes bacterium]|nr:hypothetical protein [Planctomycetota bacterium]MCC7169231.1 hypothetical protein [Planctomycetota bacterium]